MSAVIERLGVYVRSTTYFDRRDYERVARSLRAARSHLQEPCECDSKYICDLVDDYGDDEVATAIQEWIREQIEREFSLEQWLCSRANIRPSHHELVRYRLEFVDQMLNQLRRELA